MKSGEKNYESPQLITPINMIQNQKEYVKNVAGVMLDIYLNGGTMKTVEP